MLVMWPSSVHLVSGTGGITDFHHLIGDNVVSGQPVILAGGDGE